MSVSIDQLTGQDASQLQEVDGVYLHGAVVDDWHALVSDAQRAGFDPVIASAYRSFGRQLAIWNEKAAGRRPVLSAGGEAIDIAELSERELLFAILHWSALPGASRHHWGTDLDIYDRAVTPAGYCVQLTEEEVADGGIFAPLHGWLDEQIEKHSGHGFFRPYCGQNGIAAERWHISHRGTASRFEAALSVERLFAFYQQREGILLKDTILANFDSIYANYICC